MGAEKSVLEHAAKWAESIQAGIEKNSENWSAHPAASRWQFSPVAQAYSWCSDGVKKFLLAAAAKCMIPRVAPSNTGKHGNSLQKFQPKKPHSSFLMQRPPVRITFDRR